MEDIPVCEDAGVDVHAVFSLVVKPKLVEMLTGAPFKTGGGPVPVHLIDDVVFQRPSTDTGVSNGTMGKDQGLSLGEELLTWGVVSNRVALPFEIMVLTSPIVLPALKTPHDAAVPVVFIQKGEITAADPNVSELAACDEGPTRQHLRGLRKKTGPSMDDGAVHVYQHRGLVSAQQRVPLTAPRQAGDDNTWRHFFVKACRKQANPGDSLRRKNKQEGHTSDDENMYWPSTCYQSKPSILSLL